MKDKKYLIYKIKYLLDILLNNKIKINVSKIPHNLDDLSIKDLIKLEYQLIIIINNTNIINYSNININFNNNNNKNSVVNNISLNITDDFNKIKDDKLTLEQKNIYDELKLLYEDFNKEDKYDKSIIDNYIIKYNSFKNNLDIMINNYIKKNII